MRADPEDRMAGPEDAGAGRSRRGVASILVAGVAVVAFGAAVWYAYTLGARSGSPSDIPVVTAEPGPWKQRPEDPGGLKVPNQDKSVFDRLEPELAEQKVERLLPPPEEPMERPPPLPTGSSAPAGETAASVSDAGTPEAGDALAEGTTSAMVEGAAQSAEQGASAEGTTPQAPADEGSREVASLPSPSVSLDGSYRIQLAALRSEADARREWQRIQAANQDLLGNLGVTVERADLGADKGVFYRLQAGPLEDKALAQLLCGKLKSRNLGCLVVAR